MVRSIASLVVLLVAPSIVWANDDEAKQKELKALAGTWKTTRFEHGGRVAPAGQARATLVLGADGKGTFEADGKAAKLAYIIDPSRSPKSITITNAQGPRAGIAQFGIYKLEGDTLTFCFARPDDPEDARPREFKTQGTNDTLVIHERVRAEK